MHKLIINSERKLIGYSKLCTNSGAEKKLAPFLFEKESIQASQIFDNWDAMDRSYLHCLPKITKFMSHDALEKHIFNDEFFRRKRVVTGISRKESIKRNKMATFYARRKANKIIKGLLNVADPECLNIARKYPAHIRYRVYLLCCKYGERMMQAAEHVPGIVTAVAQSTTNGIDIKYHTQCLNIFGAKKVCDMIVQGSKTDEILSYLGLSKLVNKVPKNCVGIVTFSPLIQHAKIRADIINIMPKSNRVLQRMFFKTFSRLQNEIIGRDYDGENARQYLNLNWESRWVALKWILSNFENIEKHEKAKTGHIRTSGHSSRVVQQASHIWDFIRQSYAFNENNTTNFRPNSSFRNIMDAIENWRPVGGGIGFITFKTKENVENVKFAKPWLPGLTIEQKDGVWSVEPIDNSHGLIDEGNTLRHCVGGYDYKVKEGRSYIYSLKKNGESNVTIEVVRNLDGYMIAQARGRENNPPEEKAKKIIEKWKKECKIN